MVQRNWQLFVHREQIGYSNDDLRKNTKIIIVVTALDMQDVSFSETMFDRGGIREPNRSQARLLLLVIILEMSCFVHNIYVC